jgi:hypothetical protein
MPLSLNPFSRTPKSGKSAAPKSEKSGISKKTVIWSLLGLTAVGGLGAGYVFLTPLIEQKLGQDEKPTPEKPPQQQSSPPPPPPMPNF